MEPEVVWETPELQGCAIKPQSGELQECTSSVIEFYQFFFYKDSDPHLHVIIRDSGEIKQYFLTVASMPWISSEAALGMRMEGCGS